MELEWREAGGGVEWRGVTHGNDLGLVKNCTIPRTIPLAWRGVTLNTILELGRNCAILKQFLERERGVTYRVVRLTRRRPQTVPSEPSITDSNRTSKG